MSLSDESILNERFEAHRERLRAMAYRVLGSLAEADDAVQEAWLRLRSVDTPSIDNLAAWLTTVITRICLDVLRARNARREQSTNAYNAEQVEPLSGRATAPDPEEEALWAEAVGIGMLVVLDRLEPAERVAFVLHDLFDVPFDTIAMMIGRSSDATRQLASRARRQIHGGAEAPAAEHPVQTKMVSAFFAASRAGDYQALLELLDPDVLLRLDPSLLSPGAPREVRGAAVVARRAQLGASRGMPAGLMLIGGTVGIGIASKGRLGMVMLFGIEGEKICEIEIIRDPVRLQGLPIARIEG